MEAVEEGEVSEHKKGDRVLIEARYGYTSFVDPDIPDMLITKHPGVPVADLVAKLAAAEEELELLWYYAADETSLAPGAAGGHWLLLPASRGRLVGRVQPIP